MLDKSETTAPAPSPRCYGGSCRLLTGYEDRVSRKKHLYLLWAFIIPFVLLFLFYLSRGVYPFGNGSVLILDTKLIMFWSCHK